MRKASRDHSFEIAAVLCVALIAATAWAVLAAGWVHGGGGAIVVAVTSVIEAALLAQARAPRVTTAIAAPFLGLAAIVPTTLAAMPALPGQSVGAIAGRYLSAIFTGLASTQDWDFTVGLCAILFLCGYWLGWMVLREHRGVLAVIPVFSVLATNVVNAASPNPIALPETIAVVLAIGVVAAAYLGSLGDRWAASRITPLDGLGWRFGSSAAAVAVVLTIVALVLPPISTTDISARLFPHGLNFGAGSHGNGGFVPGGADTIGFNPSVILGGRLISHPQPVMTYTTNTPSPVYIRVDNDTQFADGSWFPESPNAWAGDSWSELQFPQGLLPRDINLADGGVSKAETVVTANLSLQPRATGATSLVPFPGDPLSVSMPGRAGGQVDDAGDRALHHRRGDPRPGHRCADNDSDQRVRLDRISGAAGGCGDELPGVGEAVHDPQRRLHQRADDSQPRQTVDRRRPDRPLRRGDRHPEPSPRSPVLHVHPQSAPRHEQHRCGRSSSF